MSFGSRNSFLALVEHETPAPVAAPVAVSSASSSSSDAGKEAAKPRRDDNKRGPRRDGARDGPRDGPRDGARRPAGPRKPRTEGGISTSGDLPIAREQRKPRGTDSRDRKPRPAEGDVDAPRRQRTFDRHSGTGRNDTEKKQGAGRHNWGKNTDNPEATPDLNAEHQIDATANAEAKVEVPQVPKEEDKSVTLAEYQKSLKAAAIKPPKPSLSPVETSFGANFVHVSQDETVLKVSLSSASSSASSSSSSSAAAAPKAKKAKAILNIPVGAREERAPRGDRNDREDRPRGDRNDRNDRNDRHDRNDRNDRHDRNDRNGGRSNDKSAKLRGVQVSDSEFPSL